MALIGLRHSLKRKEYSYSIILLIKHSYSWDSHWRCCQMNVVSFPTTSVHDILYYGPHSKCPLLLQEFNRNWNGSANSGTLTGIWLHQNLSCHSTIGKEWDEYASIHCECVKMNAWDIHLHNKIEIVWVHHSVQFHHRPTMHTLTHISKDGIWFKSLIL